MPARERVFEREACGLEPFSAVRVRLGFVDSHTAQQHNQYVPEEKYVIDEEALADAIRYVRAGATPGRSGEVEPILAKYREDPFRLLEGMAILSYFMSMAITSHTGETVEEFLEGALDTLLGRPPARPFWPPGRMSDSTEN